MSDIARIKRNSLFSLISSVIRLATNFVIFWMIAKEYGPEVFGQFTVAQTLALNCLFLADFGFDVLLTTDIAHDISNTTKYFQKYFSLKFFTSLIALIVMWFIAIFGSLSFEARALILIFSIYMIFSALTNFLVALYKGLEKFEYETNLSFYTNGILLILVLILIFIGSNIFLISITFAFSRIIGFVLGLHYASKVQSKLSYKLDFKDLNLVKNKVLIFGFHLLFNNLFFQLDTLLLSLWKGDHETGIYQAGFKLILLPLIIPDILTNALLPVLSRYFSSDKNLWIKTGFIMNKILIIAAIPITIILFSFSKQIVEIIYGIHLYSEVIPVIRMLSVVLVLRFFLETSAQMLTTSKRQNYRMWVVIIATFINMILNFFFINKYGALGAATVAIITNFFVAAAYVLASFQFSKSWFVNKKILLLFIFSTLIQIILYQFSAINIVIAVPIIIVLYVMFGYFIYFTKEEKIKLLSLDFSMRSIKN